ncbi:deoxynucleoside kinase [Persicobacter psychrovividus]|uniref:Deoxynucleoside kinase n=1 Tax=Persicobacter psychrovividus TaxID=387638 RepID=A0ABM7VDM3_9BACT|nr:deoxynucleoside kinase [Persicobacter psychrovividus]
MHIAIAGNIGSGKTTLTKKLAKHYQWIPQFESVDDNPYLSDFYADMPKWSFHLQVYFLSKRYEQILDIRQGKDSIIQDRTIYEDAFIFARSLHEGGNLSDRDYENYMDLFKAMTRYIQAPDLLIYLKADIPKLVDQITRRGRDYESSIRIDYLQSLNTYYNSWIDNYKDGRLLVIDVNNMDYENRVEDFATIVDKIDIELNGLFS